MGRAAGLIGWGKLLSLILWLSLLCCTPAQELAAPEQASIWRTSVGAGFNRNVETLTLEAGVNYGLASFGSIEAHHLALGSLSYGHMLGGFQGEGHWYSGNFEIRAELFGGFQFSPENDYVIGLTPHLRYNFATGTHLIPFIDIGAGVTATGIGPPDLSGTFEFNLQGGGGVHWFIRNELAITAEVRYLHLSCAGLSQPNLGLNGVMGMIGLTKFF